MVKVNEDLCIGCGACAATCPKSFVMKNGKAHAIGNSDCASAAEAGCPVDAISV
ncbi:MAG: ferredoxin [archaeon]